MSRCSRFVRASTSRASFSTSARTLDKAASKASQPQQPKTSWQRPVEAGRIPAYDESLKFLAADASAKKAKLAELKKKSSEADARELEKLEVDSEVNDPEVRWNFRHGKADFSKPVYRYLHEAQWRKEGRLATLMDRVHRAHVVPDVLPDINPSVDLQIKLTTSEGRIKTVKPSTTLLPEQTLQRPAVVPRILHGDSKLYTLVIIDPDVPNTETGRYDNYCHQLITNIQLSASDAAQITENQGQVVLPYTPPHPAQGTGVHRYVTVLLEQTSQLSPASVERLGFSLRDFMAGHALTPVGIHYFRAQWSPAVSAIYTDILKQEEPEFGRMPRIDLYKILREGESRESKWDAIKNDE